VQECVNNIVKHSQAQKAVLKIERNDNNLTVKISDNGRGFDLSSAERSRRSAALVCWYRRKNASARRKSNIESKSGKGTNVSIVINL
jgi:nitrate/nitrite-specific signal transduction histidine kinase